MADIFDTMHKAERTNAAETVENKTKAVANIQPHLADIPDGREALMVQGTECSTSLIDLDDGRTVGCFMVVAGEPVSIEGKPLGVILPMSAEQLRDIAGSMLKLANSMDRPN